MDLGVGVGLVSWAVQDFRIYASCQYRLL